MSNTTSKKIIPITAENMNAVKSLFQAFTPAALGQLQKSDTPAQLLEAQDYNGHRLECWHHDNAGQVGVLYYADGQIGVFASASVLVAVHAGNKVQATGIAVLMAENAQFATNGNVGHGLKTAQVVDSNFASDIMHVMQHEVAMPHNCASSPAPGK